MTDAGNYYGGGGSGSGNGGGSGSGASASEEAEDDESGSVRLFGGVSGCGGLLGIWAFGLWALV